MIPGCINSKLIPEANILYCNYAPNNSPKKYFNVAYYDLLSPALLFLSLIFFSFFATFFNTLITSLPRYVPHVSHARWRKWNAEHLTHTESRGPVSAWCERRFLV